MNNEELVAHLNEEKLAIKKEWIKPYLEVININKADDTIETPASGPGLS